MSKTGAATFPELPPRGVCSTTRAHKLLAQDAKRWPDKRMATLIGKAAAFSDFNLPDLNLLMKEVRAERVGRGPAYLFSLLKDGQPLKTAGSSRILGTFVSIPVGCKKPEPAHSPQKAAHLVKPVFSNFLATVICHSDAGMPLCAGPKSSGKVSRASALALAAARRISKENDSNPLASVTLRCCLASS